MCALVPLCVALHFNAAVIPPFSARDVTMTPHDPTILRYLCNCALHAPYFVFRYGTHSTGCTAIFTRDTVYSWIRIFASLVTLALTLLFTMVRAVLQFFVPVNNIIIIIAINSSISIDHLFLSISAAMITLTRAIINIISLRN